MSLESKLSNFCRLNMPQRAIGFLKEHIFDKINIFYKNSVCFGVAIDKNQCDLFAALLDYYKATRLDRNQDQEMYRKALDDLHVVLNYLKDNCITSIEIRDLMREYISFDTRTDLIDIKIRTSDIGLRVPFLDDIDTTEELDADYVQLVLNQLRGIKHSLEVTSKCMYIAKYAEQSKVVTKSIESLESQYDLGGHENEAALLKDEHILASTEKFELAKLEVIDDSTSEGRVMNWLESVSIIRDEQDISNFKDVIDVTNHSVIMHKSHSEPNLIKYTLAKLLHSSSESELSTLDSIHDTVDHLGQGSALFADF